MGQLIRVDECGTVLSVKFAPLQNDYAAWNARQEKLYDDRIREERRLARSKEQLAKEQQKRAALMAEYTVLKKTYFKTLNDRRLKKSTRTARLDDIIEAMLNIEEIVCL